MRFAQSLSPARAALIVIAAGFALRLVLAASVDLIPEEAYYWCYSRHLAWGYLDHPPLVAWLIRAGEELFGHSELAIRSGALACGAALACVIYRTTLVRHGRAAALVATALSCSVPYAFGVGAIIAPDVSLALAWAATLMFLRAALLEGRANAWLGAGVCVGLGLLSKYTITLLLPAVLVFVLVDRRSRRWLMRPQPYLGLALALVVFAPVIAWNATHDWASFAFQTTTRFSGKIEFHLHEVVAGALVMASPLLLLAARRRWSELPRADVEARRERAFEIVFSGVPLGVIALHALTHPLKLHWTGPIWLVLLPGVGAGIARAGVLARPWVLSPRVWLAHALLLFALIATFIGFTRSSAPWLGMSREMHLPVGWSELADTVHELANSLDEQRGKPLTIVGMDKNFLASELAFYDRVRDESSVRSTSWHLLGRSGLMFAQWHPAEQQAGNDMLLVGTTHDALEDKRYAPFFAELGPIERISIHRGQRELCEVFVRVGSGYRPLEHQVGDTRRTTVDSSLNDPRALDGER